MSTTKPTADGSTITYSMDGQGEPIFFFPGGGVACNYYENFLSLLRRKYTVIAVDYPGFGTAPYVELSNIDQYVLYMRSILRHFNFGKNKIVCHSMSGAVTLNCQNDYPGLIYQTIIIAPMLEQLRQTEAEIALLVSKNYFSMKRESPANIQAVSQLLLEGYRKKRSVMQQLEMLRTHSPVDTKLSSNTLNRFVIGKEDVVFPANEMHKKLDLLGATDIHEIANAGHDPELTHPEHVLQKITDFF